MRSKKAVIRLTLILCLLIGWTGTVVSQHISLPAMDKHTAEIRIKGRWYAKSERCDHAGDTTYLQRDSVAMVSVSNKGGITITSIHIGEWIFEDDKHFIRSEGSIDKPFGLMDGSYMRSTWDINDALVLDAYCGKYLILHLDDKVLVLVKSK